MHSSGRDTTHHTARSYTKLTFFHTAPYAFYTTMHGMVMRQSTCVGPSRATAACIARRVARTPPWHRHRSAPRTARHQFGNAPTFPSWTPRFTALRAVQLHMTTNASSGDADGASFAARRRLLSFGAMCHVGRGPETYSSLAHPPAAGQTAASKPGSGKIAAVAAVLALAGMALLTFKHFHVPLSKSGFFASLSLIFASEIGDKTFFIAALLAMRYGKLLSFLGSVSSLSLMTVISVVIGYAVQRVPTVVESSEILGKYLSAASLLYFGLVSLYTAAKSGDATAGEELIEAEEQVGRAEKDGTIQKTTGAARGKSETTFQSFMEIAGLIFVAEWGDRSMLATIALGAAQSPLGVAGGAILGHTVATYIAVVGGAALANHISEKTVNVIGGILFILFAAATALGVF